MTAPLTPTRLTSAAPIGSSPSDRTTSGETAEWFAPVSMTATTCTAGIGAGWLTTCACGAGLTVTLVTG